MPAPSRASSEPVADLPAPPAALSASLVGWFEGAARALPWRTERTPYRVWLSEIMLQQTRVATALDYYQRFLERFPDVTDLAAAAEDEVLALWSGLGYYRRGRNLHRAARAVVERGGFPSDVEGLEALPGVGPYTARAVASFAFGAPVAVVDGNVGRVISRLCLDDTPIDGPLGRRRTWERAQALVDVAPLSGPVNEGLMELGALVCTPRSPSCGACPWQASCLAHAEGTVEELPVKLPKRARKELRLACALITDGRGVWLERKDEDGLFGGLYALPATPLEGRARPTTLVRRLLEGRDLPAAGVGKAVVVRRTLTHRDLELHVVLCSLERRPEVRGDGARWVHRDELDDVGLPSAVRAALDAAWPPG